MTEAPHRPHHTVTFAILAVATGAYAMLQSLVAPALPTMQVDLHASTTGVAWILTAYLLSASVATPVAGRLGDMFGKKKMLVAALGVVAAGTLLAALATTIGVMLVARVIQGVGGAVFPLAFSIIRDEFPRERVPHGIAFISSIMGIGAGIGIVLAGPITQHLSYHWLFWFPLVAIALAGVSAVVFIPESPIRTPGRIDWLGAALLGVWLVALLVAVSEGTTWGWLSGRVLGLAAVAAVVAAIWVRVERRMREPLVDMAMMRLRPVWTTNLAATLIGFGMFASFVLVPEFVEMPRSTGYGFGASVTQAGLFLLPLTAAMLLSGPIAGRLSSSLGSQLPLALGALLTSLGFVVLAVAHTASWQIYLASFVMGFGIGFAFASMANLIVESVRPEQTGVATGMNTIVRNVGGSLGAEVAAGLITIGAVGAGLPTLHGFTIAFTVCAGVLGLGFVASLAVPRPSPAGELESIAERA